MTHIPGLAKLNINSRESGLLTVSSPPGQSNEQSKPGLATQPRRPTNMQELGAGAGAGGLARDAPQLEDLMGLFPYQSNNGAHKDAMMPLSPTSSSSLARDQQRGMLADPAVLQKMRTFAEDKMVSPLISDDLKERQRKLDAGLHYFLDGKKQENVLA